MDDANIDPFRAAPLAERPRCLVAPPRRNGPKTRQGYACLRTRGAEHWLLPQRHRRGRRIFGPHDCDAKSLYHANRNQRQSPASL